jgi:pyridoxal 5'-phosphate synthase pdxT subunit
MKIGVLALQGDFHNHQVMLERLGVEVMQVRLSSHLEGLSGLIIPGGESTTIGKLAVDFKLIEPLQDFAKTHAIWGTCAGAIFLSKEISRNQPLLKLMDIKVERNAFGRQVDSFEIDLEIPCLAHLNGAELQTAPHLYHAVFIRAPLIEAVYGSAHILAALPDGRIIAAQQEKLLATSFHPELTQDLRFHQYFLELAK